MPTSKTGFTRIVMLVVSVALVATSCSSSTTTISETSTESDATVSPTQAPEPTAEPAPEPAAEPATEPTAAPEPAPEPTATAEPAEPATTVFWGSELDVGMCINRADGNPEFVPPEIVPCNDLHQEEIFAEGELDFALGEPYPGDDEVWTIVSDELCAQATIDFAGEPWEVLPYDTFFAFPTEAEWDAGDRLIFCTATTDGEVEFKIGTAAGGDIDTDDVLVARGGLSRSAGEFEDWIVLTEHANIDTIGTLTDGQFDLQLRRPSRVEDGLLFDARLIDDEGHPNSTWGIAWSDGELQELGAIADGVETSMTTITDGVAVYTARAEDADWDLFVSTGDVVVTLGDGAGDQRYPTVTPDNQQVVFHDQGDLWVINIDGTDARQLTSGPGNDWENTISPDGTTVVFASDRTGNDDLWAMPLDGSSEPVNLTNHPGDESWPAFNADGTLIYFSSDRLDPENDRSRVMVMEADGSNQSWFANLQSSQAILVPAEFADDMVQYAPTLDERYNYELITGEPNTVSTWTHTSGRLSAELPAGWRVGEFTEGVGFLVAARPRDYFDIWSTDGVLVTLYEGDSQDEFFARVDATDAVQGCVQFDGSDGITEISPGIVGSSANHKCGDTETVAGVIALFNTETQVGVIIEGQSDGEPTQDADDTLVTAIALSLTWE